MRAFVVSCAAAVLFSSPALSQEPFVVLHDFHISERGDFFAKTTKEMNSSEFQSIATAACAALGGECSDAAGKMRVAAGWLNEAYTSYGGNYTITGRVIRHDAGSEDWSGVFDTFQGYEVCNAALNYGQMSITGPVFNVSIARAGIPIPAGGPLYRGLVFSATVPKNRPSGQWVTATLAIRYVPAGTAAAYGCPPDGSHPWLCKGQDCSPLTRLE